MSFLGKVGAVIPAAGAGKRFGEKKQFKNIGRRPLLFKTLKPFLDCDRIAELALVVPEEDLDQVHREIKSLVGAKPVELVVGGHRRQDSVHNGVKALSADCILICIHDCVRPFVTEDLILKTINGCKHHDGCIVASKATDTIKKVNDGHVEKTLDRNEIWLAQTPQTFHRQILLKALENADVRGTDESMLVERIGGKISVVEGPPQNRKITNPEDWALIEARSID